MNSNKKRAKRIRQRTRNMASGAKLPMSTYMVSKDTGQLLLHPGSLRFFRKHIARTERRVSTPGVVQHLMNSYAEEARARRQTAKVSLTDTSEALGI